MPQAVRRLFSLNPESLRHLQSLAERWGGIRQLPASSVVREALRIAWESENQGGTTLEKPEPRPRPEPVRPATPRRSAPEDRRAQLNAQLLNRKSHKP